MSCKRSRTRSKTLFDGARRLQILWMSRLHQLELWDTHLLQDFGLLLTLLQQMFGVACSFIENGLSGQERTLSQRLWRQRFTPRSHS